MGEGAPIVLNAANEVSVKAFLERKISFLNIFDLNSDMLDRYGDAKACDIETIFSIDEKVRAASLKWVAGRS